MAPHNSTAAVASASGSKPKSYPKLVSQYKPPKFWTPDGKQIYDKTITDYERVAYGTTSDLLTKHGNPFTFHSRNIKTQFETGIKSPMGGPVAPPPWEPLSPEQPKGPRYTHDTQVEAAFISPPKAESETIDLKTNPDAQAVKANIGILLYQEKKVLANLKRLDLLSKQVDEHPVEFAKAVIAGDIKIERQTNEVVAQWLPEYVKNDRFKIAQKAVSEEVVERQTDEWMMLEEMYNDPETRATMTELQRRRYERYEKGVNPDGPKDTDFAALPEPVAVSKTPRINWAQYGVVGESLDRVHEHVLKTMGSEKKPEEITTDGSIKNKFGQPDARFMDREAYLATASQEEKDALKAKKSGKH